LSAGSGTGRTAIVTGGSQGIGRATAIRLAQDCDAVVIADVLPAGEDVAAEIVAAGGQATFIHTDVGDRDSVRAMVAETVETYGSADVLAACAAVLGQEVDFLELTMEEWDRVIAINLTGFLHCCQAVLPHMLERSWGRIVVVSSHARYGAPERAHYGVSKAGVASIAGAVGYGYAKRGVLANSIDPGRALTQMIIPRYDEEYLNNPPGVAIGRMAQPEEIAELIAFLCSERNTYAVGALWEATGGLE
jgi:3-oxoacyl-[acyl-carrier protein] reductase